MPRCLDPNSAFDLVLSGDEGKPVDDRPFFRFRPFTVGQWKRALVELSKIERLDESDPDAMGEALAAACGLLRGSIVGWGNMYDESNVPEGADAPAIDFDPAKLEDVLALDEAMELVQRLTKGQTITLEDKKKSASHATSGKRRGARRAKRGTA